MLRRAGLPLLLLALGLAAGVLVARVPPDFERSVVTRRHHNADPLLTAVLLRFDVDSLLTDPARYFRPPFLYPDPNPQRGTEPLIAEALLAVPFRLVLGDRPAPVFTVVRIFTLALLTLATGLMLRELGARCSLALLGGGLAVLIAPTAIFFDRLQAVSLQWLPLAVLFAARFWRRGRALDAVAFAVCVFLTVQASLYTAVMLLAVAPFLAPVAWSGRGVAFAARRGVGLALVAAAAGFSCLLVLWPWLQHRADVAVFARPAFAAEKSWGPAHLADPFTSPPEWPLGPPSDWDGVFPGFAFLLTAAGAGVCALVDRARRRGGAPGAGSPAFVVSGRIVVVSLALLAVTVAWSVGWGGSGLTRAAAGFLLWTALAAWCARLALWPGAWLGEPARLRLLASAASLAALLWLLFSLGSPVRWTPFADPLFEGLFGPVSRVLGPLREMRELKRFLLPAGWAAVVALVLTLERCARGRHVAPALATVVLAVAAGERLQADTRKVNVPSPPAGYALLAESTGTGGLLELPFDEWGRIGSVHRMLWQPSHGRPIVAGRTGVDPGWYTPARDVFGEFPSEESLLLMRAWGLDSALVRRRAARAPAPLESLPAGLVRRGRRDEAGGRGEWHLFDLLPLESMRSLPPEPSPGPGEWGRLVPVSPRDGAASRATDGSLDTAVEVTDPAGLVLALPEAGEVVAVELDYGPGRFNRVPPGLRVHALADGEWRDLTSGDGATFLRARAARQLLSRHRARLVIPLRHGTARRLRLVSEAVPWDLPEVRVRMGVRADD